MELDQPHTTDFLGVEFSTAAELLYAPLRTMEMPGRFCHADDLGGNITASADNPCPRDLLCIEGPGTVHRFSPNGPCRSGWRCRRFRAVIDNLGGYHENPFKQGGGLAYPPCVSVCVIGGWFKLTISILRFWCG